MADHAVLVVVNVVLIEQRCHLHPVSPQGCQDLLHVVCAQMDGKHVAAHNKNYSKGLAQWHSPVVGAVKIPDEGSMADPALIVQ